MTVESKPKLRLREIDMLYALGTLLVILGHSHPNDWSTFPGKWIEFIYTFHMPLFFLIAGYLFAYSDSMSRMLGIGAVAQICCRALRRFHCT